MGNLLFNPNGRIARTRFLQGMVVLTVASVLVVAGNTMVWKGAPSVPLVSVATTKIVTSVLERIGLPGAVCALCTGQADVGERLAKDGRVKLVSFTGSTEVGRKVAVTVQVILIRSRLYDYILTG